MLKVGDRVSLFFNMGKKGIILSLHEIKNNTWLVGGAASSSLDARVQFDDGTIVEYPTSELMPIND